MTLAPLRLVVPCFDEARRLPVAAFHEALRRFPSLSLVLVDDGSRDGTLRVLEAVRAGFEERVVVHRLEENRGKGEAVRTGMRVAFDGPAPRFLGYWDADLSTPFEAAFELVADLERDPALLLVMGSRLKTLGSRIERRATRHYLGRVVASAISRTLALPVYDTQCGAKVLRATPLTRSLWDEPFLTRWLFDVELLARLIRLHRQGAVDAPETVVREHPLRSWTEVPGSKVRARELFRSFPALARIRKAYLRGPPRRQAGRVPALEERSTRSVARKGSPASAGTR